MLREISSKEAEMWAQAGLVQHAKSVPAHSNHLASGEVVMVIKVVCSQQLHRRRRSRSSRSCRGVELVYIVMTAAAVNAYIYSVTVTLTVAACR